MAVEYIRDIIRITAGEDADIGAVITDEEGVAVTDDVSLMLHLEEVYTIEGVYSEECWTFTIPAEMTQGLKGKYHYCICQGDSTLCFKTPLYLM